VLARKLAAAAALTILAGAAAACSGAQKAAATPGAPTSSASSHSSTTTVPSNVPDTGTQGFIRAGTIDHPAPPPCRPGSYSLAFSSNAAMQTLVLGFGVTPNPGRPRCLLLTHASAGLYDGHGRLLAIRGNPRYFQRVWELRQQGPDIVDAGGGYGWRDYCGDATGITFRVTLSAGGNLVQPVGVPRCYNPADSRANFFPF